MLGRAAWAAALLLNLRAIRDSGGTRGFSASRGSFGGVNSVSVFAVGCDAGADGLWSGLLLAGHYQFLLAGAALRRRLGGLLRNHVELERARRVGGR